jgi:hypothetical protein
VRLRILALFASLVAVAPLLTACENDGFLQDAIVLTDTVVLGLPGSDRGSALDLVRASANATLVRRPERLQDAEQWDIALRRTEAGALVLRPYDALGTGARGAGIAVAERAFEAIDEAPRGNAAYSQEDVPATLNATYFFRSRQFAGALSGSCVKYAKAKIIEVDAALNRVRFALAINENCDDERLTDD